MLRFVSAMLASPPDWLRVCHYAALRERHARQSPGLAALALVGGDGLEPPTLSV